MAVGKVNYKTGQNLEPIAQAITSMNQSSTKKDKPVEMAEKIKAISTDATATEGNVLNGQTFYSGGSKKTGNMPNNGAVSSSLNAGASYTIPAGYHNGSGKVVANSLASQTSATATAPQILTGQTAWVNGSKLTGSMPNMTGIRNVANTTTRSDASLAVQVPPGYYSTGNWTNNYQVVPIATLRNVGYALQSEVNALKIARVSPDLYSYFPGLFRQTTKTAGTSIISDTSTTAKYNNYSIKKQSCYFKDFDYVYSYNYCINKNLGVVGSTTYSWGAESASSVAYNKIYYIRAVVTGSEGSEVITIYVLNALTMTQVRSFTIPAIPTNGYEDDESFKIKCVIDLENNIYILQSRDGGYGSHSNVVYKYDINGTLLKSLDIQSQIKVYTYSSYYSYMSLVNNQMLVFEYRLGGFMTGNYRYPGMLILDKNLSVTFNGSGNAGTIIHHSAETNTVVTTVYTGYDTSSSKSIAQLTPSGLTNNKYSSITDGSYNVFGFLGDYYFCNLGSYKTKGLAMINVNNLSVKEIETNSLGINTYNAIHKLFSDATYMYCNDTKNGFIRIFYDQIE